MSEPLSPSGDGLSFGDRLRYGAEAAVFFAFMAVFRVIGLSAASRLGGFIGRNIFSWLPPDRIARANLLRAFP
jgi:Kdo2-lipid IVA lauroyltransferase/acyltransferase